MTQVYIGISAYGTNQTLRDSLFNAAENVGLDTSLCKHIQKSTTDNIHKDDAHKEDAHKEDAHKDDKDDIDVFKSDISKLLNAKCAILELSNASHSVGFCAGYLYSDRPKLPILGLIKSNINKIPKKNKKTKLNKTTHGADANIDIDTDTNTNTDTDTDTDTDADADICDEKTFLGALIKGCPSITLCKYNSYRADEQLPHIIHNWLVAVGLYVPKPINGPTILITGPPSTGKTTQGYMMCRHLNIPYISTHETLRQMPDSHPLYNLCAPHITNDINNISTIVMKQIILERLSQKDCQHGYILDDYPSNVDNCIVLKELGIQPTLVIHIYAQKQTCIDRQLARKTCNTDKDISLALKRVTNYISGFPSLGNKCNDLSTVDEFKIWFPDCKYIQYDTSPYTRTSNDPSKETVFTDILHMCNFAFTIPPVTQVDWKSNSNSNRVHFHINAANQQIVSNLATKSCLPCKIYPIDTLLLDDSTQLHDRDYVKVYSQMPNFNRTIYPNQNEAFATGILSEDTLPQYIKFLDVLSHIPLGKSGGLPIITMVEEYIWILKQFYTSTGNIDGTELREYASGNWSGWTSLSYTATQNLANNSSLTRVMSDYYEIHHSFDIPKLSVNRGTLNDWLKSQLQKVGNIGGIFIFENANTWAIRTNEYYNGSYLSCRDEAILQQRQIKCPWIISELKTSIELVHGIWTNAKN